MIKLSNKMFAILISILMLSRLGTEGSPLLTEEETTRPRTRIIGGVEATPHSLPYQAGLVMDNKYFCGGTLISNEHILTVAHCVEGSSSVQVILGAHNLNYQEDTQQLFYNPVIIIHANYSDTSWSNDIALLKLNKHAKFTSAVKPIHYLADNSDGDFIGKTGLLSGWGYTTYSATHIEAKLQKVYVDVMANRKCHSIISLEGVNILESHICTCGHDNFAGPVGACFGDSGSPLVVENILVGLVCFGAEVCESGYPTVYTRVSYFRKWIAKYSGV